MRALKMRGKTISGKGISNANALTRTMSHVFKEHQGDMSVEKAKGKVVGEIRDILRHQVLVTLLVILRTLALQ